MALFRADRVGVAIRNPSDPLSPTPPGGRVQEKQCKPPVPGRGGKSISGRWHRSPWGAGGLNEYSHQFEGDSSGLARLNILAWHLGQGGMRPVLCMCISVPQTTQLKVPGPVISPL